MTRADPLATGLLRLPVKTPDGLLGRGLRIGADFEGVGDCQQQPSPGGRG